MAKWQKIKYKSDGTPYVTFNNARLDISDFVFVSGSFYYQPCIFCAYRMDVDPVDNERVKITFEKF